MCREPPEQLSSQPTHSFRESELSLLTESSDSSDVKVNTPNVAPEIAHRYPKLAGADWTCYITTDRVVLGRSPGPEAPRTRRKKIAHVDIDFGPNKRDVSRFHAEIRYSNKRIRWELRVHGKNGVKVNHNWKTPKESPVPLTTGSLIEILGNRFVFILPANGGIPISTAATPDSSSTTPEPISNRSIDAPETDITSSQDDILREIDADGRLEAMIVEAFQERPQLTTDQIMEYITQRQDKEGLQRAYDKSSVLHALILNPKFHLLESFADNDADQQLSDPIQWRLRPSPFLAQDNIDDSDYGLDPLPPDPQLEPYISNDANTDTTTLLQPQPEPQPTSIAPPSSSPPCESNLLIRGISIEDVYTTWMAAQQLKKQASFMSLDEPVNSPNIPPAPTNKRSMDESGQDLLKRQRSGLSARKLGQQRGTGKPWKDVRTMDLTFFAKR